MNAKFELTFDEHGPRPHPAWASAHRRTLIQAAADCRREAERTLNAAHVEQRGLSDDERGKDDRLKTELDLINAELARRDNGPTADLVRASAPGAVGGVSARGGGRLEAF